MLRFPQKEAMTIKNYYIIMLVILPIIGKNKSDNLPPYLQIQSTYDLSSEEAITKYLPERLKLLQKEVVSNGIQATIQALATDTDLDSFLFIFDAEKPYRILAYSRTPAFTNKTPDELQPLLDTTCKMQKCSIKDSISQIAFVASHKITTYTSYWWPTGNGELKHYISYACMVSEDGKQFIVGVTMPHSCTETRIILPHRANQVLKRIKKEGFEKVSLTIGKNIDFEKNALIAGKHTDFDYFFIEEFAPPNRLIAHRTPSWVGLTPPETGEIYSAGCTSRECDVVYISKGIIATARDYKEGFFVYLWQDKPTSPSSLKIEYVKTLEHKGKKYVLCSGLSADIPGERAKDIMQYVDSGIALIKEIGLFNAISAFKRSNTPERYLFISPANPPYKFLLHVNPDLNGKTSAQVQALINKNRKNTINIDSNFKKIIRTARNGEGFLAYEWFEDTQTFQSTAILKVAYTKLFTYNDVDYIITSGIPVD